MPGILMIGTSAVYLIDVDIYIYGINISKVLTQRVMACETSQDGNSLMHLSYAYTNNDMCGQFYLVWHCTYTLHSTDDRVDADKCICLQYMALSY